MILGPEAAGIMLRALSAVAASVELDGIKGSQPLMFDRPQDRMMRARTVTFDIPPFATVAGYSVRSADGTVLWRDTISPPEEFGARGGLFDLKELTVSI